MKKKCRTNGINQESTIMTKTKIIIVVYFFLGCTVRELYSQNNIVVSGGEASGASGEVSYSIGQVVYITSTGTNGSVAQGVEQPFEISVLTGLEDANEVTLLSSVYPNPTTEFITLTIDKNKLSDISYQLYDSNGKLLQNKKMEGTETKISMENLAPATYFLKVTDNEKEIKLFKVIKN